MTLHLVTTITIDPRKGAAEYRARCGFVSDNPRLFAKVKGWIQSTLAGVTCCECGKGIV